jgi:catalase (peroxidase I)
MKRTLTIFGILFALSAVAQETKKVQEPNSKTETTQYRESAIKGQTNKDWWPNQLNIDLLRQNSDFASSGLAEWTETNVCDLTSLLHLLLTFYVLISLQFWYRSWYLLVRPT